MTTPRVPRRPLVPRGLPVPLVIACVVAALEALVLIVYGVVLVPAGRDEELLAGLSLGAFVAALGVALGFCAWRLAHTASWARAPVVLAQLIAVLTGFDLRGSSPVLGWTLVVTGVVVLVGVFHPRSLAALETDPG